MFRCSLCFDISGIFDVNANKQKSPNTNLKLPFSYTEKLIESDLLSVRTNTSAMKAATAVTMAQRSIATYIEPLPTGKLLQTSDAAGAPISSNLNASL